jgi:hypothetical protein
MREEDCIVLVLESVGERESALLFVLVNHRVNIAWIKF